MNKAIDQNHPELKPLFDAFSNEAWAEFDEIVAKHFDFASFDDQLQAFYQLAKEANPNNITLGAIDVCRNILGEVEISGSAIDEKSPTEIPTGEWVSNIDGQVVTVTKCETNVFWTAGGINFRTDRSTFEKHYTPKNAPQKEVPGLKTPPRDFLGEWETTLSQIRQLLLETPLEVMPSKQVTKALGAWKTLKQCVRDSV